MTEKEAKEIIKNFPNWNLDDQWLNNDKMQELTDTLLLVLEEVQQYRAIGTVTECLEAMEKQTAKKLELYGDCEDGKLLCPSCKEDLWDLKECGFGYCPYCGQAIDWE